MGTIRQLKNAVDKYFDNTFDIIHEGTVKCLKQKSCLKHIHPKEKTSDSKHGKQKKTDIDKKNNNDDEKLDKYSLFRLQCNNHNSGKGKSGCSFSFTVRLKENKWILPQWDFDKPIRTTCTDNRTKKIGHSHACFCSQINTAFVPNYFQESLDKFDFAKESILKGESAE